MEKNQYFHSLSALRGGAILCIVLYHSGIYYKDVFKGVLSPFLKYGGTVGNCFFFFLSGFLLAYTNRRKIQAEELTFLPYLKKRLIKIYPLYFLVNLVCIFSIGWAIRHEMPGLKQFVYNTLLINWGWVENIAPLNGPGWFMSVLLLCYIIFFFLCWVSRKNQNMFMYLSLVMAFWGYIILNQGINRPFMWTQDGEGFLSFFLGCFWSELYVRLTEYGRKSLAIIFSIILVALGGLSWRFGFSSVIDDVRMMMAILVLPAIIWVSIEIGWLRKILEFKAFVFVGKISLSIMLWHRPLLDLTYVHFRKPLLIDSSAEVKFVLYMIILLIVCIPSYYLFEKHNLIYKLTVIVREKTQRNGNANQDMTE